MTNNGFAFRMDPLCIVFERQIVIALAWTPVNKQNSSGSYRSEFYKCSEHTFIAQLSHASELSIY